MLRRVEISDTLLIDPVHRSIAHNLYWNDKVELSLDCFICERTGRTTTLQRGAERAVCTADEEHGEHYSAVQITAFDHTQGPQSLSLRALIDFWWAPFHDAKRDRRAMAPSAIPWVRLHLGSYCPEAEQAGQNSVQTNLVRPAGLFCEHCERTLAVSAEAPRIHLLT